MINMMRELAVLQSLLDRPATVLGHQVARELSDVGCRSPYWSCWQVVAQTEMENTHWRERWSIVSAMASQSGHKACVGSPRLVRRSAVQQRFHRASQA
jgi:hypothetical protein